MNQGKIVQSGRPDQIYTQPASEFVVGFIGNYNLLAPEQGKSLFGAQFSGKLALRPEAITLLPVGTAVTLAVARDQLCEVA